MEKESVVKIKKTGIKLKKYNPDVYIVIDDGKIREKLLKNIFKKYKNLIFKNSIIDENVHKNILKKMGY